MGSAPSRPRRARTHSQDVATLLSEAGDSVLDQHVVGATFDEELHQKLCSLDDLLAQALLLGDIRLVDREWLLRQPPERWLGCRERLERLEEEGEHAGDPSKPYVSNEEAVRLLRRGDRSIGAVSYCCLSAGAPERAGNRLHLAVLQRALLGELVHVRAVFWDFLSMRQRPAGGTEDDSDGVDAFTSAKGSFERALGCVADVYASAVGTTVLQMKEVEPMPEDLRGALSLFKLANYVSKEAIEGTLCEFGRCECEMRAAGSKPGAIARFGTHAEAAKAKDAILQNRGGIQLEVCASADFLYNERSYEGTGLDHIAECDVSMDPDPEDAGRGWCVFESLVGGEVIAWLTTMFSSSLVPKLHQLPPKMICLSSRQPYHQPVDMVAEWKPERTEEVAARIEKASFTLSDDRARVTEMYREYVQRVQETLTISLSLPTAMLQQSDVGEGVQRLVRALFFHAHMAQKREISVAEDGELLERARQSVKATDITMKQFRELLQLEQPPLMERVKEEVLQIQARWSLIQAHLAAKHFCAMAGSSLAVDVSKPLEWTAWFRDFARVGLNMGEGFAVALQNAMGATRKLHLDDTIKEGDPITVLYVGLSLLSQVPDIRLNLRTPSNWTIRAYSERAAGKAPGLFLHGPPDFLEAAATEIGRLRNSRLQGLRLSLKCMGWGGDVYRLGFMLMKCSGLHLAVLDMEFINLDPSGPLGVTPLTRALRSGALLPLSKLHLGSCRLGDQGLKLLSEAFLTASSRDALRVESLDLSQNSFSSAGAKYIAKLLQSVKSVRSLVLWGNMLRDEGMKELVGAMTLCPLQLLDLRCNHILSNGAKRLAQESHKQAWEQMERLKLGNNNLGNDGVEALARMLLGKTSKLEDLDLFATGVSDRCLAELAEQLGRKGSAPCLRRLHLDQATCERERNSEGLKDLRSACKSRKPRVTLSQH